MIIYNVTINIDHSVHEDWLEWMKNEHVNNNNGRVAEDELLPATKSSRKRQLRRRVRNSDD